jgi:hypothetical protein
MTTKQLAALMAAILLSQMMSEHSDGLETQKDLRERALVDTHDLLSALGMIEGV